MTNYCIGLITPAKLAGDSCCAQRLAGYLAVRSPRCQG